MGIEYEEVSEVLPMDEANDWKKFFQDDSKGIMQTGQLFFTKGGRSLRLLRPRCAGPDEVENYRRQCQKFTNSGDLRKTGKGHGGAR